MGHTLPSNRISYVRQESLINVIKQLHIQHLHCIREARKLIKKKIIKGNVILKLKKKIMQPGHSPYCTKLCRKLATTPTIPITTTSVVAPYPYQQNYNYPLTMNDWAYCDLHAPLIAVRTVPVIIPASSPIFPQLTPLIGGTVIQPMVSPILPQSFVQENVANISNYTNDYNLLAEQFENVGDISNEQSLYIQEEIITQADINSLNNALANTSIDVQSSYTDLESYLKLPKELFPTPNMLSLDPNPIIDEFCKMSNIQRHLPWILDLEFGIPKAPITRPIPTYNVKYNSIHCKNAPDAIHPGFESCDPDFKKVLLFYYDCVVSAWYKGYMILHCDRSVENFQSWLLRPMQVLGMCWP